MVKPKGKDEQSISVTAATAFATIKDQCGLAGGWEFKYKGKNCTMKMRVSEIGVQSGDIIHAYPLKSKSATLQAWRLKNGITKKAYVDHKSLHLQTQETTVDEAIRTRRAIKEVGDRVCKVQTILTAKPPRNLGVEDMAAKISDSMKVSMMNKICDEYGLNRWGLKKSKKALLMARELDHEMVEAQMDTATKIGPLDRFFSGVEDKKCDGHCEGQHLALPGSTLCQNCVPSANGACDSGNARLPKQVLWHPPAEEQPVNASFSVERKAAKKARVARVRPVRPAETTVCAQPLKSGMRKGEPCGAKLPCKRHKSEAAEESAVEPVAAVEPAAAEQAAESAAAEEPAGPRAKARALAREGKVGEGDGTSGAWQLRCLGGEEESVAEDEAEEGAVAEETAAASESVPKHVLWHAVAEETAALESAVAEETAALESAVAEEQEPLPKKQRLGESSVPKHVLWHAEQPGSQKCDSAGCLRARCEGKGDCCCYPCASTSGKHSPEFPRRGTIGTSGA